MTNYEDRVSGRASAQFDDLYGTVAADNSDSDKGGLSGLAALIGGKNPGWPIAMSWFFHEENDTPFVHVSLYTIPPAVGITNGDEARDYINAQSGEVETNRFSTTKMSPTDFLALFKRFDVMLSLKGTDINQFNVINSIDADN